MAENRSSDELLIAAKAVVSWIRQSELPVIERVALQNNVFRILLALNRLEAEYNQIGRDTRLERWNCYYYSDIYEAWGHFHSYSVAPYTEWYCLPEAYENIRRDRAMQLWRQLKYEKLGILPWP